MSEKYKSATPSVQVVETICARKSPWTGSALCPIMGFLICNFSLNCYFHDRCFTNLHSDSVLFNNKQKLPKWGGQNTRACICICQTTIVRSVFWCNLQLWPFQHDLWWTQGMCYACTFLLRCNWTTFTTFLSPILLFFSHFASTSFSMISSDDTSRIVSTCWTQGKCRACTFWLRNTSVFCFVPLNPWGQTWSKIQLIFFY